MTQYYYINFLQIKMKFLKIIMFPVYLMLPLVACETDEEDDYFYNDDSYTEADPIPIERTLPDWCSLSCERTKNIVCIRGEKCDSKSPCSDVAFDPGKIVSQHNDLRNKFAVGDEKISGGLKVANMMALKWDTDLAYTARCNMADCGELKRDLCHRTKKFMVSGQNQWSFSGGTNVNCADKAIDGIQSWYNEIFHVTLKELKEYTQSYKGNSRTKQFTQLIWAQTTHLGCAMIKKVNDMGLIKCMLTCNYGPGATELSRVFHQGVPCSECPDSFCKQNGGLCWISENTGNKEIRNTAGRFIRPNVILLVVFLPFLIYISL